MNGFMHHDGFRYAHRRGALINVFISTYTAISNGIRTNSAGPVMPLLNYFKDKVKNLYLLEQPLPGSDYLDTQLTIINNGREAGFKRKNFLFPNLKKKLESTRTYISLKLRDICSNFYFLMANYSKFRSEKIDLFIGVESINAICGIFMKKLGLVDTVVYYIFDWAPDRYPNPVMNKIYIFLDKIATYYSDYTWNITYTIGEARKDILNYDEARMSPQFYVPYSIDCEEDKILPDDQINTNLIIYSGGLIEENGPQLLIPAFKLVLEKFPSAKLLIIGGGDIEHQIKNAVIINDMQQSVRITGYIANEEEIMDLQRQGAVGIAPYPIIKGSRKPFGDVIKIRSYFACGLVTVSTPVPPVSKEIQEESLGYTTKDDSVEEIAKGISLFLKDRDMLFKFRGNVLEKAKLTSWEKTYTDSLEKMSFSIGSFN